jgi:hypothetical protein
VETIFDFDSKFESSEKKVAATNKGGGSELLQSLTRNGKQVPKKRCQLTETVR